MTNINKQVANVSVKPSGIEAGQAGPAPVSRQPEIDPSQKIRNPLPDDQWADDFTPSPSIDGINENELAIAGNLQSDVIVRRLSSIEKKLATLEKIDEGSGEVGSAKVVVSQILSRLKLIQQSRDGLIIG